MAPLPAFIHTHPTSVPGPMTTAESLKGLSEWVNMHSRALGLTFTGYFIIAFGAGYATHLKCEARRVEMLRKCEARRVEMLREMDEKHKAKMDLEA